MSDWRDEGAYEKLKPLDRPGFAWEYLRRNPRYREDHHKQAVAIIGAEHGVRVIDAGATGPPPVWGLRFRRGPGPRRPGSPAVLGWRY